MWARATWQRQDERDSHSREKRQPAVPRVRLVSPVAATHGQHGDWGRGGSARAALAAAALTPLSHPRSLVVNCDHTIQLWGTRVGSALHRPWLARTKQACCKSMFFAARAPPSSETSGHETGGGSGELRPPSPTQCLRCRCTSLADSLFSVSFPFAGTGWPSIVGGEGEAQLREIQGAACQVREATA